MKEEGAKHGIQRGRPSDQIVDVLVVDGIKRERTGGGVRISG